jgi:SAM-dependent methyltransferase
VPAGALVLDAGAGTAPYAGLFSHATYESADFEKLDKAYASTYVCDLAAIPVEDARYDAVVFNQVMEHLPEPARVLAELGRVIKPGGRMIYTGPFFYEEHEEPYDFYRYTRFGLRHLFENAGFAIERLDWLEGYFGTVGYQFNRMSKYLPLRPKDLGGGLVGLAMAPVVGVTRGLCALAAPLFHRLEMRAKYTRRGYPKNYLAILRKRENA